MQLNFPVYEFDIVKEAGQPKIYDMIRRKYMVLTPEEWVRQHLIKFLVQDKNFPASLIAVERQVMINGLSKRFDLLVFDHQGLAFLLAELKSPDIKLTQDVLEQIANYNSRFSAPYLFVSNGLTHVLYLLNKDMQKYEALPEMKSWEELLQLSRGVW